MIGWNSYRFLMIWARLVVVKYLIVNESPRNSYSRPGLARIPGHYHLLAMGYLFLTRLPYSRVQNGSDIHCSILLQLLLATPETIRKGQYILLCAFNRCYSHRSIPHFWIDSRVDATPWIHEFPKKGRIQRGVQRHASNGASQKHVDSNATTNCSTNDSNVVFLFIVMVRQWKQAAKRKRGFTDEWKFDFRDAFLKVPNQPTLSIQCAEQYLFPGIQEIRSHTRNDYEAVGNATTCSIW